ncbi:hypothetical protein HY623_01375 [Candidatus Uhrbacteria bacterium]|nr:hypothetical protein [Candidatus Uhrbacteria bacterium]
MLNERAHKELLPAERYEKFILPLAFVCGMSLPPEARAAEPHARESLQPLTAEQLKEVRELEKTSPLAKAIDAVPDSLMREEGYDGDILSRKERAKSQIPILYDVRWKVGPGEKPLSQRYPLINVEIFTNGAFIYFNIPDDARLHKLGITREEMEVVASEIKESTTILTDMPAHRVSQPKDSNLIVFFSDNPQESSSIRDGRAVGHTLYTVGVPISFFPLGTVYPIEFIEPGSNGGVYIPLESYNDKIEKMLSGKNLHEKTRELIYDITRHAYFKELIYTAEHEICHFLGYGHSNNKKHITYGGPGVVSSGTVVSLGKRSGKKPVIPEGASLYTDKMGNDYYFLSAWGDIRKSPVVDLNFFLRIFAKQNKERKLMEERNQQHME